LKLSRAVVLLFALPVLAADTPAALETWTLDKSHSNTTFRVRHLMSTVSGSFNDFDVNLQIDRARPESSKVEFTIKTASIDTENHNRDEHLRSADFFDAEKYPAITFKSTAVKARSKDEFAVTGDLTMRGVTKRVTLPVTFLGFLTDNRGREKAGFSIETTLNRKDYDIVWNRALDTGGFVLGDDVKVIIDLQVAKK
jgi:polyisoprenoid-binding protein YceI